MVVIGGGGAVIVVVSGAGGWFVVVTTGGCVVSLGGGAVTVTVSGGGGGAGWIGFGSSRPKVSANTTAARIAAPAPARIKISAVRLYHGSRGASAA